MLTNFLIGMAVLIGLAILAYICLATHVMLHHGNKATKEIVDNLNVLIESQQTASQNATYLVSKLMKERSSNTSGPIAAHESITRSEYMDKCLNKLYHFVMRMAIAEVVQKCGYETENINVPITLTIDQDIAVEYCDDWYWEKRIFPTMRFDSKEAFKKYLIDEITNNFHNKQNIMRVMSVDEPDDKRFVIDIDVNSEFFTPVEKHEFKIARLIAINVDKTWT